MKTYLRSLIMISMLSLTVACGDGESVVTCPMPAASVVPTSPDVPVVREWTLYARACKSATIPLSECADWQTEGIPDVEAVSPVQAGLGNWSCHTLGIQHFDDRDEVTLWCGTNDQPGHSVQVVAHCGTEDRQEDLVLLDTDAGRYYEVIVLCSVR